MVDLLSWFPVDDGANVPLLEGVSGLAGSDDHVPRAVFDILKKNETRDDERKVDTYDIETFALVLVPGNGRISVEVPHLVCIARGTCPNLNGVVFLKASQKSDQEDVRDELTASTPSLTSRQRSPKTFKVPAAPIPDPA